MLSELQKRKKLLSSTFSKAVSITLLIHLICLAIFKVKMSLPAAEAPPIIIQAEASIVEFHQTELQLSENLEAGPKIAESAQKISKPSSPHPFWKQPQLEPIAVEQQKPLDVDKHIHPRSFEQLERLPFELNDSTNLSYGTSYRPVKVELFGDLAKRSAQFIPYREDFAYYPKNTQTIPFLFTFNVKVENKTGEIFWIAPSKESHELASVKKLELLAQKIAKDIRFKRATKDSGITPGTIEILFEIEEGKSLPKNLIVSK